jgi:hypothetical protein
MILIDSRAPELRLSIAVVAPVVIGFAGIGVFLVRLAIAAQRQEPPAEPGAAQADANRSRRARPGRGPRRDLAGARRRADFGRCARARRAGRWTHVDGFKGLRLPMVISPILILALIVAMYIIASLKILSEYERAVIFRLGKLLPRPKGPGVILVFAPIDRMVRVGLRTVVFDVPPQDVITRDNVSVKVNAVLYFRVMDPVKAIIAVENYNYATSQLAQTTLRSVLGQVELDDLLSQRERLNQELQQILDHQTDP